MRLATPVAFPLKNMPNEVTKNEDGTVEVRLETGEVYKGDPIKVLDEMGESYVSGKRWTQNIKAENENLKAQHLNPPAPPPPATAVNSDVVALRNYLGDELGQYMGYKGGEELKSELEQMKAAKERQVNSQIAEDFMLACPEFPSNDDAVNKLTAKVDQMGWQYNQQSLMAAHLMCVREKAYEPLTPEQINASWAQNMQVASGTTPTPTVPPTPPQGGAPGNADQTNPWAMTTDELRKKVLEGGGLGKALMEMPTGGSMG